MRQSTLIFVFLALGVASAATNNWAGTYKVTNVVADKCQPKQNMIIAQREKNLYIEFVMPTAECDTKYYGTFKAFPEVPEGDSVSFTAYRNGDLTETWKFSGTLKKEGETITFTAEEAVTKSEVTKLERIVVKPTVEFAGTWKIISKSGEKLCFPKNEITIANQDTSSLLVSWTWESSDACKGAGLEGKFQVTVPTPEKNQAIVYIRTKDAEILGYFTVSEKTASWASLGGGLGFERSSGGSFFIIVLILLVVVVGGVLFIQKKKKDEELSRTLASNSRSHLNA